MKSMNYSARWARPGQPSIGNVSFQACSDAAAKRKADRLARELGLSNIPRTLARGYETIEVLQTGTTED